MLILSTGVFRFNPMNFYCGNIEKRGVRVYNRL